VLLYQSGYLTIEKMIQNELLQTIEYKLKIPNIEVQISLNDYIINYLFRTDTKIKDPLIKSLYYGKPEELKDTLTTLFSSIPYTNYTNNDLKLYEGFYASVVYSYLASLGVDLIGEDVTNNGRVDLTVFVSDKIYVIEFKVDGEKGEALSQIKHKNYAQKYLNTGKDIYLVGIEFSSEEKNIVNFEWEKLS
jgi:hypothetical protein